MKIGIFGDSFGDDYSVWPNPYTSVGPSWIDYLKSQNIEIDNFSCGGTGLYFSYQQFIKYYQKYDKIIFCVTSPGRINVVENNGIETPWYNLRQVEKELKNCFDYERKIKLTAIRDYFIYVKNDKFDKVVHKLLIEDILKKHKDTLLIPCFADSGIDNHFPLFNMSHFEANFWNMIEILPNSEAEYDARKCHMCEENNLMLGQEIYNWVETGNYNLSRENFKTPTKEFSHYFRTDFKILKENQK